MKQNWGNLSFKTKLSYILCVVSFVLGALFSTAGFIVSPLGEISGSVLGQSGIYLSFSGAILGIGQFVSSQLEQVKDLVKSVKKSDKDEEE